MSDTSALPRIAFTCPGAAKSSSAASKLDSADLARFLLGLARSGTLSASRLRRFRSLSRLATALRGLLVLESGVSGAYSWGIDGASVGGPALSGMRLRRVGGGVDGAVIIISLDFR